MGSLIIHSCIHSTSTYECLLCGKHSSGDAVVNQAGKPHIQGAYGKGDRLWSVEQMVTYFNIIVYVIVVKSTMKKHSGLGSCIQRTLPHPISADSPDDMIFFFYFFKLIYLFSLAANYFTIL